MNKRLPDEIFSIVKKLDNREIKAFEKYSLKKRPEDGKEHRYIKLFNLYISQTENLNLDEPALKEEAVKFSKSIDDLHQKLHGELLKFLVDSFREKNAEAIDEKINEHIDTGIALFEKGLFTLSAKSLLSAIKLLKQIHQNDLKERTLYLSLKGYAWIFTIKFKAKLKEEEEKELDEFENFIRPFTHIARSAYSVLTESEKLDSLRDPEFDKATFYALLNIYFREKIKFENSFKGQGNSFPFPILTAISGRHKKFGMDEIGKKAEESIIETESFYFQLERMYKAILANDISDFDNAYDSIKNRLFPAFSMNVFNAELLLFVYRQLFEIKTIFTLENNQRPIDINGIKELERISRKKIELFRANEIEDFALRVEFNSFVILFLEKNYRELLKRIGIFEKDIKKDLHKEYYIDIRLMDIICRIETGGHLDEELDNRVNYYENYTKKYPSAEFHRKFDGFIKAFLRSNPNDRKNTCTKYLPKLETAKETFNHFHSLFLFWVRNKTDK